MGYGPVRGITTIAATLRTTQMGFSAQLDHQIKRLGVVAHNHNSVLCLTSQFFQDSAQDSKLPGQDFPARSHATPSNAAVVEESRWKELFAIFETIRSTIGLGAMDHIVNEFWVIA